MNLAPVMDFDFDSAFAISQTDEIDLIYEGEYVTFDCPDRRIVVRAVENHFGLKKVLFDKKCYPTDATGLTFKRFGEGVKSLTVTGEPSGLHFAILPNLSPWDHLFSLSDIPLHVLSHPSLDDLLPTFWPTFRDR